MPWSGHSYLSLTAIFLITFTLLLQLIALTTTWWAKFTGRTELGKPKEEGHYGIWTICSTKGPHWTEDCDRLDTFFQVPSYLQVAGVLGIIHLLILLAHLFLESLWAVHMFRSAAHLCIKPKTICITKVSIAFVSVIFAILVAILTSVGENRDKEYLVRKGWSFWMQIAVIGINIALTMLCVIGNLRFWEEHIRRHVDPEGSRAETFGNPTFGAESPEPSRRQSNNEVISYTESSGHPYESNAIINRSPHRSNPKRNTKKGNEFESKETAANTLTFENESYLEHSPSARRLQRNIASENLSKLGF